MARKPKETEVVTEVEIGQRPRLTKLIIRNFRCIGSTPVTIDLDDIVVLVGPNNVGKSSVLKAYEVIMSQASADGELKIDDFPFGKVNPDSLPEIELHTIVYDNSPGSEWIEITENGEMLVKEKWVWNAPGKPDRVGYLTGDKQRWAKEGDKEKVPWGAPGVANSRRPQPHRVDAFESPDEQTKKITNLLMTAIIDRVKSYRENLKTDKDSDYAKLISGIAELQKKIVAESQEQVDRFQIELSEYIRRVFPNHQVKLDAKPEDDLENSINLFKTTPQLLMGPQNGHMSTVDKQGSGARRTLLWTAIKLLAENQKKNTNQRPHVLLLDEPEICLHPGAIREACDLIYSLPDQTKNWQVMITTHSPIFVDFNKDHTSFVRVEQNESGHITGTTIFRPSSADFDVTDKQHLKLLNLCDPYVAEFFFGGQTIVVEGDTEYTAFKYIINMFPDKYKSIHVIRARGKATIVSLCKILNQFGTPYSILHDSDKPTCQRDGKDCVNPAWTENKLIQEEISKASATCRIIASLPYFEKAYLAEEHNSDKPYNALCHLKKDSNVVTLISQLLDALIDFSAPVPHGALEWKSIEQLREEVEKL